MKGRKGANGKMPPMCYWYNVAVLIILERANSNADEKHTIQTDFLLCLLIHQLLL